MLKEDKDINIDGDTLNRSNFAENLSLNIQNYFNRSNNCLTIGLMGEWGSGKTSILNMTEDYLKDSKIIIIKFNPWLYSSYNQLVQQFFDELIRGFTDSRDGDLKKLFKEYKLKINELNIVKNVAIAGASAINPNLGSFIERTFKTDSEEKNLEKIKKKINDKLSKHKVVCIIDDLDRLSRGEIAEMFKLIKIMADFKNVVYLVAFDKGVVAEALKNDYGGEKYIEKIINVPLNVPSIDYIELKDILVKHFERISREYQVNLDFTRLNQFLDFNYDQYGKHYGILYLFKNMRDIVRFINILEFNLELVIKEVNLVDFIVITAIQVFYLDIYDKIKLNEFLLINYHYNVIDDINKDIINFEKVEFEEIVKDNENMNHILRILFPKMGNIYLKHPSFKFKNEDFADKNLLISHPNHFKAYFKLNSIIKDLSESETEFIVNYINSKNNASVVMEFTRLYKENKLKQFFENIKNRLDKIHKNKFFLNFLFTIETQMWEDIFFANKDEIEKLCLEMIYQIGNIDRFNVLKEIYQNSNNVILLFDVLECIKHKNNIVDNHDEPVFSDEEIIELAEITKDKFNKIENNSYVVENMLKNILYIGSELHLKSKDDSIIDELISTSSGILNLLNSFLSQREHSSMLLGNIKTLNSYRSVDEIKKLVDNDNTIKEEQIVKNFLEGYELFKNQLNS